MESITGSSPSTVVLTLTCPPRRSSNSYVSPKAPPRPPRPAPALPPAQIQQLVRQLERPLPVHDRDKREVQDSKPFFRSCKHRRQYSRIHHKPPPVPLNLGPLHPTPVPEPL